MPSTRSPSEPEIRAALAIEITRPEVCAFDDGQAPRFVLLDARGPQLWTVALAFGVLSTLVALLTLAGRTAKPNPPLQSQTAVRIALSRRRLLAPPKHAHAAARSAQVSDVIATLHSQPPLPLKPVIEPYLAPLAIQAEKGIPKPLLSAPVLAMPQQPSGTPPPRELAFRNTKLKEAAAATFDGTTRSFDQFNSLGDLPLQQLVRRESFLAADLERLTPAQRSALPKVWIRVNAEWLEVLPQTQEKLYFSVMIPEANAEVLAYSAVTHAFTLEQPRRPLWRIRDVERVPALLALRSAAGRQLRVPPDLVGLYTWHPPIFENALQMFVLERMQQLGVKFSSRDSITVSLVSAPSGYVMKLEPIRAVGPP